MSLSAITPLLIWIAVWSLVTFAVYAYDKRAAKARRRRVPETTLHTLALVGGFVGGWIGRQGLRHKTRKPKFAVVLTLATVVHAGLLGSRLFGLW